MTDPAELAKGLDLSTDNLRRHLGELTTAEVLTARAAIRWALDQLASTQPPPDDEVDALLERMDNDRYNIASVDPDDAEKAINLIRSYRERLASTMSAEEVREAAAKIAEASGNTPRTIASLIRAMPLK